MTHPTDEAVREALERLHGLAVEAEGDGLPGLAAKIRADLATIESALLPVREEKGCETPSPQVQEAADFARAIAIDLRDHPLGAKRNTQGMGAELLRCLDTLINAASASKDEGCESCPTCGGTREERGAEQPYKKGTLEPLRDIDGETFLRPCTDPFHSTSDKEESDAS